MGLQMDIFGPWTGLACFDPLITTQAHLKPFCRLTSAKMGSEQGLLYYPMEQKSCGHF